MSDRSRTLLRLLQVVVVAAAAGLIILRFIALDAGSHSASDTLRPWLVQAGLIALVAFGLLFGLGRIAARTTR